MEIFIIRVGKLYCHKVESDGWSKWLNLKAERAELRRMCRSFWCVSWLPEQATRPSERGAFLDEEKCNRENPSFFIWLKKQFINSSEEWGSFWFKISPEYRQHYILRATDYYHLRKCFGLRRKKMKKYIKGLL